MIAGTLADSAVVPAVAAGAVTSGLADLVAEAQANVADIPFDEPVGWVIFAMVGLAVVAGPVVLAYGARQLRIAASIALNDPVDAGAVHLEDGVVEVVGTATPLEEPLSGTYSGETALAQTWRRVEETEETDDGDTQTTTRTVSSGRDAVCFLVEDETGSVAVDPTGANLSIGESLVASDGPRGSENRYTYDYEGRIEPGDAVHVYGQVRSAAASEDAPGDGSVYVGDGGDVDEFVVSDASALRTALRYAGNGLLVVFVALLWIPSATFVFTAVVEEALGVPLATWLIELLG